MKIKKDETKTSSTQNGENVQITTQKDLNENTIFQISRKMRWFIFCILLLCLGNLDQGAISASTTEIKKYFKMSDRELGSFGGIAFLGTTLGGIFSLSIINKFNRKYMIMILLILNTLSIFIPTIITSKNLLMFCRILSGFAQSFTSIYLPVWVDQFGISNKKSIMMSLISLPSALGYLVGNIFAVLTSWKTTFNIGIFINFFLFICFYSSNNLYFSKTVIPKKITNPDENNNTLNDFDDVSLFEDASSINSTFNNLSVWSHAKKCFKSKIFRLSNLGLICLLFILSGLQFWINDFLENTVKIPDKNERLIYFIIIILITMLGAPVTGGFIMQKIGGYESKNGILLPFYCCIISLIFSNLLIISINKYCVAIFICGYLFTGCIMIASLNGIIMSSIPKEYAGSASAISNLSYNILGRLNGPNFYGILRSFYGNTSRIPMILLLDVKFVTLICLYFCYKYKRAQ